MRPLQYILPLDLFNLIREGKSKASACPWWQDCICQIKIWICQDRTTTKDNLRDKAMTYARNYLFNIPEVSYLNKDDIAKDLADKVEHDLKDVCFDQRPPASVVAQNARQSLTEDPEERFIKLS